MRKITAREHRESAAKIAEGRQHPVHVANGEERAYREDHSFMSFTKGLPHHPDNGLVRNPKDPIKLRAAIDSGYTRDFDLNVPLGDRDPMGNLQWLFHTGADHRRWEAPTAGFVYDLEGPDAQAVTMPPAPTIVVQNQPEPGTSYTPPTSAHGLQPNPELIAEIAEVYWLSLLRDRHLSAFDSGPDFNFDTTFPVSDADAVQQAVDHLKELDFYETARGSHPRRRLIGYEQLTRQNVFRGHTPGERKGPYLSQFMLMGDGHLKKAHSVEDGKLQYGALRIDMRVRKAKAKRDYMTHWNEWLDVQNGAHVIDSQEYEPNPDPDGGFRFITTLRDLTTYVHFDALYEAYLNACLWLLNAKAPVDPRFRHLLGKTEHTEGFALYGGPHILSLMTEVATRGLKAVRFQKFNTHLRLRPEALAGLIAAQGQGALSGKAASHVGMLSDVLDDTIGGSNLLQKIRDHNGQRITDNHAAYPPGTQSGIAAGQAAAPLPMAFPEGARRCTRPMGLAMPRSPVLASPF
ncbi:MAG: bromoperoxidase [Alphaproteobacteria bacterium]